MVIPNTTPGESYSEYNKADWYYKSLWGRIPTLTKGIPTPPPGVPSQCTIRMLLEYIQLSIKWICLAGMSTGISQV